MDTNHKELRLVLGTDTFPPKLFFILFLRFASLAHQSSRTKTCVSALSGPWPLLQHHCSKKHQKEIAWALKLLYDLWEKSWVFLPEQLQLHCTSADPHASLTQQQHVSDPNTIKKGNWDVGGIGWVGEIPGKREGARTCPDKPVSPQMQQVRPVTRPSKKLPPSSPGGSWLPQGKLSAAFPLQHVLLPILLPGTQQSSRGNKVKWDRFSLLP